MSEYVPEGKNSPRRPGGSFEGRSNRGRIEYLSEELRREGPEALRSLGRLVQVYKGLAEATGSKTDLMVLNGLEDALARVEGAVREPSDLMRTLEKKYGISNFFISYSSRDEGPMKELHRQLQRQGKGEVFRDRSGVRGLGLQATPLGREEREQPRPLMPTRLPRPDELASRGPASRGLGVGVGWQEGIDRAVKGTDALIVMFSQGVLDKPDQVCREIVEAVTAGKHVFPFADTREVIGRIQGLKGQGDVMVDRAVDHVLGLNIGRLPEGSLLEEMTRDPQRAVAWMLSEAIIALGQKEEKEAAGVSS